MSFFPIGPHSDAAKIAGLRRDVENLKRRLTAVAATEAAGADPLIIGYFSNAGQWFTSRAPSGPPNGSVNTVKWIDQAGWSGSPVGIISSDFDTDDGAKIYADVSNLPPGPNLLKVEFSLDISAFNSGAWVDVSATQYAGTIGSWATGSYGNWYQGYGSGSEFPCTTIAPPSFIGPGQAPQRTLWFYTQLREDFTHWGVSFDVHQSYPTDDSDYAEPFCQCVVSCVKRNAFEGTL